jgi:hypothetical protein
MLMANGMVDNKTNSSASKKYDIMSWPSESAYK